MTCNVWSYNLCRITGSTLLLLYALSNMLLMLLVLLLLMLLCLFLFLLIRLCLFTGEVGKEMYIVNRGRLHVVADNGKTVLSSLKPGSYDETRSRGCETTKTDETDFN
jgi:hypothetical protein